MATNIGNPAFRMAPRMLLVHRAPGGCAPRLPGGYVADIGGDIFLSPNLQKKHSIF